MSLANTPLILGDIEVASNALNSATSGILVDGNDSRVSNNRKVRA